MHKASAMDTVYAQQHINIVYSIYFRFSNVYAIWLGSGLVVLLGQVTVLLFCRTF